LWWEDGVLKPPQIAGAGAAKISVFQAEKMADAVHLAPATDGKELAIRPAQPCPVPQDTA